MKPITTAWVLWPLSAVLFVAASIKFSNDMDRADAMGEGGGFGPLDFLLIIGSLIAFITPFLTAVLEARKAGHLGSGFSWSKPALILAGIGAIGSPFIAPFLLLILAAIVIQMIHIAPITRSSTQVTGEDNNGTH